jgi:glycosyltransferase involved in cell wall biosynthesis
MTSPREVLILEPDAEGHAQEWLQHLVEFVAADATAAAISVLAPPALCAALSRSMPVVADGRIRFIALKPRELRLCTHRSLSIAAFARWWTMRRYLARTGADSGFFLSLDLLCLPLALGLRATGKPIAGVLFRPSVHYRTLGKYQPSSAERMRDLRKDLLYRLTLRNPCVRAVLSLDPFFPAHAESHYNHGLKVRALPEPPIMVQSDGDAAPAIDFAPPGRVGLLLFGYLTERKGPLEVLDALRLLPTHISKRTALLLAGRIDPAIQSAIKERCAALARERPELWVGIEDRWLSRAELEVLVARSDVVLAPYQRFVGSSGVLLWAARAGRPVLAQEFGLVGRLTRDHRLGAVADSSDPARLAHEIERMIVHGPQNFIDVSSAKTFALSCTPYRFASTLLSSLSERAAA